MKPIRQIDIILIACGAAFSCITSVSASAQETGTFMRNPAESRTMSLAGAGVVSLDDVSVLDNAALSPFLPLFSFFVLRRNRPGRFSLVSPLWPPTGNPPFRLRNRTGRATGGSPSGERKTYLMAIMLRIERSARRRTSSSSDISGRSSRSVVKIFSSVIIFIYLQLLHPHASSSGGAGINVFSG